MSATGRRAPKQARARQTLVAILDAVIRILKKEGLACVTTNRIAAVAGVSIGSVYQYFPDKRAIFQALHDRHVDDIGRLIERTLVETATLPLEETIRSLVGALVDAHGNDPELHELLATEVPHGDGGRALQARLSSVLRLAISSRSEERRKSRDMERILFVLPPVIEALAHGTAARRPPALSLAVAKDEAVRVVMAYLRA